MEKTFYSAVWDGKVEEVKDILRKNLSLNVNWKNEVVGASTALYAACLLSHDSVVSILLAHPGIDPNLKEKDGWTPFMIACANENPSCVRVLLQDQRIMVNEPNNGGSTPLWWAASNGHHDVIKWWIASGREMDLGTPGDVDKTDAIGRAKANGKTEVVSLLERFKSDASKTRSKVRLELGITGKSVSPSCSSLFVLFILHLSFGGLTSFSSSSQFLDFPVTTPPKLTRALYEDYLDDKAIKRDYIAFLERKPVITSTTTTGTKFDLFSFSFSFFFSFNLS